MMRKNKLTAIILALMVSALGITACGSKPEAEAPETTPAPVTSRFAAVPKANLKVGFLYPDAVSDRGYSYVHDLGAQFMEQELGLSDSQVVRKEHVPEDSSAKQAMQELIDAGCQIIFGTAIGYMDSMEQMAAEHPDIIFSHCGGTKSNEQNFNTYYGRMYQADYLAGIAAGMKTVSGQIGYVGDSVMGSVVSGCNAFALGAASVNPNAVVHFISTITASSVSEQEKTAAIKLMDDGCDVIAQHSDSVLPQQAAAERGVFGCGYNMDMTEAAPTAHLVAPVWNWGVYYAEAVKQVMNGSWTSVNYIGGLGEGIVDISPLTANCAPGTAEKISAVRETLMDGSFDVFNGPVTDNQGVERIKGDGFLLTDAEILAMDWWASNVVTQ